MTNVTGLTKQRFPQQKGHHCQPQMAVTTFRWQNEFSETQEILSSLQSRAANTSFESFLAIAYPNYSASSSLTGNKLVTPEWAPRDTGVMTAVEFETASSHKRWPNLTHKAVLQTCNITSRIQKHETAFHKMPCTLHTANRSHYKSQWPKNAAQICFFFFWLCSAVHTLVIHGHSGTAQLTEHMADMVACSITMLQKRLGTNSL